MHIFCIVVVVVVVWFFFLDLFIELPHGPVQSHKKNLIYSPVLHICPQDLFVPQDADNHHTFEFVAAVASSARV